MLIRMVHSSRARGIEQGYLRRRRRYASTSARDVDSRSRELLAHCWSGPRRVLSRTDKARIFCVAAEWEAASPFVPELTRSFDLVSMDLAPIVPRLGDRNNLAWRAPLQAEILEMFEEAEREAPIDLALFYVSAYECEPETISRIRSKGVPVAVLSMDDKHAFDALPVGIPNGQRPLIGSATVHLTNSSECVRWYIADGAASLYFPEGADPEIFRSIPVAKDIDVSFVGGWYGGRRELIAQLRSSGLRVECFGPGTEHGLISREEMVNVFNRSRVNLGFNGVGESSRIVCLKGRDFEVPMTGNAYVTQYVHELSGHFRIGTEIACYLNEYDCAEQVEALLADPKLAEEMGLAARERALLDHTWTRRMESLLSWLGIKQ